MFCVVAEFDELVRNVADVGLLDWFVIQGCTLSRGYRPIAMVNSTGSPARGKGLDPKISQENLRTNNK